MLTAKVGFAFFPFKSHWVKERQFQGIVVGWGAFFQLPAAFTAVRGAHTRRTQGPVLPREAWTRTQGGLARSVGPCSARAAAMGRMWLLLWSLCLLILEEGVLPFTGHAASCPVAPRPS